MTTGELLFYSGWGLLGLTAVLAVVFFIRRPKYRAGDVADAGNAKTAPLKNGFPTQRVTKRREGQPRNSGVVSPIPANSHEGTVPLEQGTERLEQGTERLEQGTERLEQGTELLIQSTMPLSAAATECLTDTSPPPEKPAEQGSAATELLVQQPQVLNAGPEMGETEVLKTGPGREQTEQLKG